MAWPAWPIDEDKALARYVLPEVGERVRITIVRDDEIKKGNRLAVVGAIYEALRNCDFRYGREKYVPEDGPQLIRDPGDSEKVTGKMTWMWRPGYRDWLRVSRLPFWALSFD